MGLGQLTLVSAKLGLKVSPCPSANAKKYERRHDAELKSEKTCCEMCIVAIDSMKLSSEAVS
jgi:hypothetical protein